MSAYGREATIERAANRQTRKMSNASIKYSFGCYRLGPFPTHCGPSPIAYGGCQKPYTDLTERQMRRACPDPLLTVGPIALSDCWVPIPAPDPVRRGYRVSATCRPSTVVGERRVESRKQPFKDRFWSPPTVRVNASRLCVSAQ